MRISLLPITIAIFLIAGCGQNEPAANANGGTISIHPEKGIETRPLTTVEWSDASRNFGKIEEGQKLAVSFRFRNTGDKPLVISSVSPSCGCTVADFPRKPIAPGKEGEITGEFDSKGRVGLQHKDLTVHANTAQGVHRLSFEVNVVAKETAGNR